MAEGKKYVRGMKPVLEVLMQDDVKEDNRTIEERRSAGALSTIYIHVPFCTKICSFCNMQRSLQKPRENYGELIIKEINRYKDLAKVKNTVFDAVYFGGGTPTTLSTESLRCILRALKNSFTFTKDAEFTIETTVTQLTQEKIEMFQEEGVNRFSVGVQTFSDTGRKLMGRIGSGAAAFEKLEELKKRSFATVSMDLIYNYPGQTLDDLKADLDRIITLDLDGFSMYSLIDMKETKIEQAQNQENDETMFSFIAEYMQAAGYHFLELTKMVKKDEYRYVMNRHRGADTLPLGAGAGGNFGGIAMMNPINLDEYEHNIMDFNHKIGMYFASEYKELVKFKGDLQSTFLPKQESLYQDKIQYEQLVASMLKEGYIQKVSAEQGYQYQMTVKGIFWGNTISRELSGLCG